MRAQPRARLLHEIFDVEMLGDLLDDPLAQPGVGLRIKRSPPEVRGDVTLVVAFGMLRTGPESATNGARSSCRQR